MRMHNHHTTEPATLEEAQALLLQQQQELERLHHAHEAWMRVVAHDLRAPLRHVMSFAPLLREAVEDLAAEAPQAEEAVADAREFVGMMEQSARKMSAMLEGLSQVSRATRAALHLEVVDWGVLLAQVLQPLQQQHPRVQWAVAVQPALIMADVHWLKIAMQAVLDNAVKFSSKAAVPMISVHIQALEPGWWRMQVKDNGAGFDAERAQSLGELFQRMHREQEFEGVGCGLALVDVVAQRHGARWQVQAQPQAGCTVSLDWPAPV